MASDRVHRCECGFVEDRDLNAAVVMLKAELANEELNNLFKTKNTVIMDKICGDDLPF